MSLRARNAAQGNFRACSKAEADLIPDGKAKTITVRLHPLSNQRQDEATKILAKHLNETETVFPGNDLVMRFELVSG